MAGLVPLVRLERKIPLAIVVVVTIAASSVLVSVHGAEGTEPADELVLASWPDVAARDADLDSAGAPAHRYVSIPAALLYESEARALLDSGDPELRLWSDDPVDPYLTSATSASRADRVWGDVGGGPITTPEGETIDGDGVGIAVIDTGIDTTHAMLRDGTAANYRVLGLGVETPLGSPYAGVPVPMENSRPRYDIADHGTQVASIALGRATDGSTPGAAPGASLYGFGVTVCELNGHCFTNTGTILAAMDWVVSHHAVQDPPIRVVSVSMGSIGTFDPDHPMSELTSAATDAGLVVLFAAGNGGGDGSQDRTNWFGNHPAPGVISVANYDDHDDGGRDHGLASSSSRGAEADPSTWPDLSAPGTTIRAARGGSFPTTLITPSDGYQVKSGTSMATPHVAGIAALMLQADPTLTPGAVEAILERTAYEFGSGYAADPTHPGGNSSFDKGHGLVDAQAAVHAVLG